MCRITKSLNQLSLHRRGRGRLYRLFARRGSRGTIISVTTLPVFMNEVVRGKLGTASFARIVLDIVRPRLLPKSAPARIRRWNPVLPGRVEDPAKTYGTIARCYIEDGILLLRRIWLHVFDVQLAGSGRGGRRGRRRREGPGPPRYGPVGPRRGHGPRHARGRPQPRAVQ